MNVPVLGFVPPIEGVDGSRFNTFRLGLGYAKRLQPGQVVFLMDEKTKTVFGRARVLELVQGTLKQLCMLHGKFNHRELGKPEEHCACDRLFEYIRKLYGPQIATEGKKCVVIYLERLPDDYLIGEEGQAAVRQAQGQDGGGGAA